MPLRHCASADAFHRHLFPGLPQEITGCRLWLRHIVFLIVSVLALHRRFGMPEHRRCTRHRAQRGVPRYRLIRHVPLHPYCLGASIFAEPKLERDVVTSLKRAESGAFNVSVVQENASAQGFTLDEPPPVLELGYSPVISTSALGVGASITVGTERLQVTDTEVNTKSSQQSLNPIQRSPPRHCGRRARG